MDPVVIRGDPFVLISWSWKDCMKVLKIDENYSNNYNRSGGLVVQGRGFCAFNLSTGCLVNYLIIVPITAHVCYEHHYLFSLRL